eukprot:jgi/Astpho2/8304/Aster-x1512
MVQDPANPERGVDCTAEADAAHPRGPRRQSQNVRASFLCPISLAPMAHPVRLLHSGHRIPYDRQSIEQWLATGSRTDPLTGVQLQCTCFEADIKLQQDILAWFGRHALLLETHLALQQQFEPQHAEKQQKRQHVRSRFCLFQAIRAGLKRAAADCSRAFSSCAEAYVNSWSPEQVQASIRGLTTLFLRSTFCSFSLASATSRACFSSSWEKADMDSIFAALRGARMSATQCLTLRSGGSPGTSSNFWAKAGSAASLATAYLQQGQGPSSGPDLH